MELESGAACRVDLHRTGRIEGVDPVLDSSRSGHDLRESASVGVVLGGSWCVWWSDEASSVNLRVCLTVCVSFV